MAAPRGVGLSAFQQRSNLSTSYAARGAALRRTHLDALAGQLSAFEALLRASARSHRAEIARDPAFRAEFARMCGAVGLDPLAIAAEGEEDEKGGKGGMAGVAGAKVKEKSAQFDMLVGVRVVEVCRERRDENGGLMGVRECKDLVARRGGPVGREIEVTEDDILRAVEMLEPLKGGFSIVTVGDKKMIRSVPKELSKDQAVVLAELQGREYVTVATVTEKTGWDEARAVTVLEDLVSNSMVWVCDEPDGTQYWAPPPLDDFDAI